MVICLRFAASCLHQMDRFCYRQVRSLATPWLPCWRPHIERTRGEAQGTLVVYLGPFTSSQLGYKTCERIRQPEAFSPIPRLISAILVTRTEPFRKQQAISRFNIRHEASMLSSLRKPWMEKPKAVLAKETVSMRGSHWWPEKHSQNSKRQNIWKKILYQQNLRS